MAIAAGVAINAVWGVVLEEDDTTGLPKARAPVLVADHPQTDRFVGAVTSVSTANVTLAVAPASAHTKSQSKVQVAAKLAGDVHVSAVIGVNVVLVTPKLPPTT